MKNTGRQFYTFLFTLLLAGLLFLSCGLDVIYSVDAPITTFNYPTYSSSDETTHYFDFRTVETSNNSADDFVFLGTAVYYKIYNNYSSLSSQRSAIIAVNTTSNGSSAATKMIQTYTYQPLGTHPNMSWSTFIPNDDSNRRVRFRLKNLSSATTADSWSTDTAAMICTNYENGGVHLYCGVSSSGGSETFSHTYASDSWTDGSGVAFALADKYPNYFVIPYRYDNERTFDFFDDNDDDDSKYDIEPVSGDDDYYYSSSSSAEDTYYVQLFAVGIARDSSYTLSYSLVLDLGSIPISK